MDLWAYQNGVKIDFSRPGKATSFWPVMGVDGFTSKTCPQTSLWR
jgi:hypothetical protein